MLTKMAFCSKIHLVANQCGNSSVVEHLLAKEGVCCSPRAHRSIWMAPRGRPGGVFCCFLSTLDPCDMILWAIYVSIFWYWPWTSC